MADGIAIGVGSFLSDSATNYFKRHKKLPPRDLLISSVTVPTGAETFENLLLAIKASRQTSFLVYAHGRSDGGGLYIQLATRQGAAVGTSTEKMYLDTLLRLVDGNKAPTDRELGFLGINKGELDRLKGLINDVRAKNIDTLEFRGCNLGRDPGTMKLFKSAFGATTFGAPDFYSFFGTSTVNISQKFVDDNEKLKPSSTDLIWRTFKFTFDNPSGVLINNIATDGALKPKQGFIVADSLATVQRFYQKFVDPNDTFKSGENSILLHGMWDTGKRKITQADLDTPLGSDPKLPDPALILPFGAEDYKTHTIYV